MNWTSELAARTIANQGFETASRLLDHQRMNCRVGYMASDSLQKSNHNLVAELAKNLVAGLAVSFVAISQFVVQDGGPLQ